MFVSVVWSESFSLTSAFTTSKEADFYMKKIKAQFPDLNPIIMYVELESNDSTDMGNVHDNF